MAATTPCPSAAMLKNGSAFVSEERPAVGPKRTSAFGATGSLIGPKSDRWALLPRARYSMTGPDEEAAKAWSVTAQALTFSMIGVSARPVFLKRTTHSAAGKS